MNRQRVAIIVPTLNAASLWNRWVEGMRIQTFMPDVVLIVDSASDDGTAELALAEGYRVHRIARMDFNHGGTRQLAVDLLGDIDIAVFLTQDAILVHKDSIRNIVASFDTGDVGMAYGRQLPRKSAGHIEAHARLFNYPEQSRQRTAADIPALGVKTVFTSNSFSAYRVAALKAVGGFPDNVIVSEDMYVAARMILAGWRVHYNAEAVVEHSHGYTFLQEFRRYFDIGAFHAREQWVPRRFGTLSGEGLRFVLSEWRYLGARRFYLYLSSIVRTAMKLLGFRLGLLESKLPLSFKRAVSMQKAYWK
ncbi:MAG: glycosyltransferase family 2 protein [Sulfuricaulis sp.]|uniref:glycosyltransferase family 2 protein n=1 Tax=Sulfuricaulis sp. TaxID=2003553 RepID=UPI0025E44444|nr:glycosyltransferase [Sulfuricaulis sp.]MCR4347304.1 glycosyltransferase family 2 protein [Sulfuricaulis sp.]